ncbi:MAG: hypothetical protein EOP56_19100 [Sphingobacteriales bacterium]|nr:MAG: hypothetical protein EOP56_19100 [Sphingobacteriales bacterium]
MKKLITGVLCTLLATGAAHAQSKVFKEVSEGMTSSTELIMHDDQLVGYLRFTQLEKANKDSFNYSISIMDENLNEIGSLKFRDEQIQLQSVAYEQDVLCLAYLKSNIIGTEFKNRRTYKRSLDEARNGIMTQFINLDGKILNTNAYNVSIDLQRDAFATQYYGNYRVIFTELVGYGNLKHPVQVGNIPGKGFACFFGDEVNNYLYAYDLTGKQLWKKTIADEAQAFTLHTSGESVYLLAKREDKMEQGGYEMLGYAVNGSAYEKFPLKDKNGNSLKALSIANDPASGKAFITGLVINNKRGNKSASVKGLAQGPYDGVFTMHFNGPSKNDVEQLYSYWNDGSKMPALSKKGYNYNNKSYTRLSRSFRDFEGNTYFVGSSFNKKVRWGTIITSVILVPTVFMPPYLLYGFGTQKSTIKETVLMKQDADGNLTVEQTIPGNRAIYVASKVPTALYDSRRFYHVINNDTKNNYMVINDTKDISVYNVEQGKVMRTIPHYKGGLYTNILPAKEGHVLVTEYNAKEKTTRYSIETL